MASLPTAAGFLVAAFVVGIRESRTNSEMSELQTRLAETDISRNKRDRIIREVNRRRKFETAVFAIAPVVVPVLSLYLATKLLLAGATTAFFLVGLFISNSHDAYSEPSNIAGCSRYGIILIGGNLILALWAYLAAQGS